jgi:hypothetical protein
VELKISCVSLDSQPYHTDRRERKIEGRTRYDSYSAKPRSTKPFFIRAQDVCDRLDIDLDRIQKLAYSQNPPMVRRIICDRSLLDLLKGIHHEVIRSIMLNLKAINTMDIYLCSLTGPAYM